MAESLLLTTEDDDETTEEGDKKSEKRSRSSAKIGASVLEKGAESPTERAEPTKLSPLDKIFASLFPEKESKTGQKSKAEGIFAAFSKEKAETSASPDIEQILPIRELAPNELSGGEVVIDLRAENIDVSDDGELIVVSQNADTEANTDLGPDHDETVTDAGSPPPTASRTPINKPTSAGSGRGGNMPPPPRPTPSPPPPPRPTPPSHTPPRRPPVVIPTNGANFNVVTPQTSGNTLSQILAQQHALEQASYYGRRRGRAEGLLGGVIIGGLVEHFRHKSRERKMERRAKQEHQKQAKQIENLEFQQKLLQTEQLEVVRKEEADRYERKAAAKQELAVVARAQMSEAEAIKHAREVSRANEAQERDKAALIERLNAQAAKQEQLETEKLLLNPENRIATSAWHAIEVDKTGHAVQETNIEYGHEYYRERGHEAAPKDVVARDSVTGAAALTAAAMSHSSSQPVSQSELVLPPMLGMPVQAASTANDSGLQGGPDSSFGDQPGTNLIGVLLLLAALAVVVILIIVLI